MVSTEPLVLIVDDELPIRRFLRVSLAGEGYRVVEAATAGEALDQIAAQRPDVVVLDLGLPDRDGVEVIREIREWSSIPIVVLSVRDRESDKVAALETGADDYLTKPFGVGELMARLRVALRHASLAGGTADEPVFTTGELRVDLARRQVFVSEREVRLTPIEYKLLALLVKNAGKVLTHRQLLRQVWGPEYGDENHYVRVYVAQLRRKIEADPARPRYLRTESGVGYRLVTE
ncbi:MAG: DNA-binding response regulator [Acidobacteria bacterium RBG_13_68_16]|jgi:two-component system KDP operon response regulator KdpE|nr:MAG: DNA-binding response regulator [Acidobacteria bacterium RBG_13_68_16]